mmetsp:Transcript_53625/g.100520  ORF Transcript_53625/g.100520 Transcript_53625/m.100520 type:complete len:282 (+) Transcript_53625:203-1048(+)
MTPPLQLQLLNWMRLARVLLHRCHDLRCQLHHQPVAISSCHPPTDSRRPNRRKMMTRTKNSRKTPRHPRHPWPPRPPESRRHGRWVPPWPHWQTDPRQRAASSGTSAAHRNLSAAHRDPSASLEAQLSGESLPGSSALAAPPAPHGCSLVPTPLHSSSRPNRATTLRPAPSEEAGFLSCPSSHSDSGRAVDIPWGSVPTNDGVTARSAGKCRRKLAPLFGQLCALASRRLCYDIGPCLHLRHPPVSVTAGPPSQETWAGQQVPALELVSGLASATTSARCR